VAKVHAGKGEPQVPAERHAPGSGVGGKLDREALGGSDVAVAGLVARDERGERALADDVDPVLKPLDPLLEQRRAVAEMSRRSASRRLTMLRWGSTTGVAPQLSRHPADQP
jgi:hypothetical protein